jgi:hypothetical protein
MCNVGEVGIDKKDKLMCCVVKYGHLQVVKYLVSQGADICGDDNCAV